MTEKLYYENSYTYNFQATVTSITNEKGISIITLDKTAFFPEGGGQSADNGKISSAFIYDVQEIDGIIYHYSKDTIDFNSGDTVACSLDSEKRFARMQAHSGEHIVSGIAHKLFDVDNVGFHMDDLLMTVDFNKTLSKEDIELIEREANKCVYANAPIAAEIYNKSDLDKISFRSKIDFPGPARLVIIDGIDICACCAPHVKNTGEIGLIKILSIASHRGGVRITMICGYEAYSDYVNKYKQTLNIAALLCSKHSETDIAVRRLLDTNSELRYKMNALSARHLKYISDNISAKKVILEFFDDLSMDELRELANLIKCKADDFTILLSGNDENGYSYCIMSEKRNLMKFVKEFNTALNGSGGGRGVLVQGKLKSSKANIISYVSGIEVNNYENA